MRRALQQGVRPRGGILSYPLERLHQEVAYLSYYFHWPPDAVMELTHRERHVWVREIGRIHEAIHEVGR